MINLPAPSESSGVELGVEELAYARGSKAANTPRAYESRDALN